MSQERVSRIIAANFSQILNNSFGRISTAVFLAGLIFCVIQGTGIAAEYAPGELIVIFKAECVVPVDDLDLSGPYAVTGDRELDLLHEHYKVSVMEPVFSPQIHVSSVIPDIFRKFYRIRFNSSFPIEEVIESYRQNPRVEAVEPNYISRVSYMPNDSRISSQRALTGISAFTGWDYERGNASTVIAIIDTGVDYYHEDLVDNMLPGYDFVDIDVAYWELYYTLYPDEEDYTTPDADPMDVVGHGTHCAGIASAVTDNNLGVAGVAFNCSILPVRAGFKADSSALLESTAIANSLYYAADQGADVISMSFGGSTSTLQRTAVEYAYSRGCVLVAASGNENTNCDNTYPAAYPQVISVGAVDRYDQRASFSNYGSTLEVVAPGVSVLSTIPMDRYTSKNGTSMATPHVAGLAALLCISHPAYTVENIRQTIKSTTDDLGSAGFDNYYGYGRINMETALQVTTTDKTYLLVTYNDIGIWRLDPITGFDSQPLGETFHHYVYHTASGDLDGDGIDELYADFGNPDGIQVKNFSPEQNFVSFDTPAGVSIVSMFSGDVDGDGSDELYINCGAEGIYQYKADKGLSIAPLADTFGYQCRFGVSADTDGDGSDELYLDYGLLGVWQYRVGIGWASMEISGTAGYLANWASAADVSGDMKDELYFDYGLLGIWRFDQLGWGLLPGTVGYEPVWGITMDGDGNNSPEFYIDYGILGIWEYDFSTGWGSAPLPMTAGDRSDFAVSCETVI